MLNKETSRLLLTCTSSFAFQGRGQDVPKRES